VTLILDIDRWRIDGPYSQFLPVQTYQINDWQSGWDFFGAYAAGKIGPVAGQEGLHVADAAS
jgi:hypothetical protein